MTRDSSDGERLARIEAHVEHIRGAIEGWTAACSAHRSACATERERNHMVCNSATCARLVLVEDQAKAVGRVRLISAWLAWALVAAVGIYELGARHAWW